MILRFHDGPNQGRLWPMEEGSSGRVKNAPMCHSRNRTRNMALLLGQLVTKSLLRLLKEISFAKCSLKHFDFLFFLFLHSFLFSYFFIPFCFPISSFFSVFLSLFPKQKHSNVCGGWRKGKLENVKKMTKFLKCSWLERDQVSHILL